MFGKIFSRRQFQIVFLFSPKYRPDSSCKLYPSLGDNLDEISDPIKKNIINVSSAALAQSGKCYNRIYSQGELIFSFIYLLFIFCWEQICSFRSKVLPLSMAHFKKGGKYIMFALGSLKEYLVTLKGIDIYISLNIHHENTPI